MPSPLVSVIIPTFNRVGYLEEAIASALAQTYEHIEVIVSDDGDQVEVEALVDTFDDPRLRYRENEATLGQALNNRAAFPEAQGRYVANLHDDDRWSPDFLSTLVPHLENHPNVSVAFSDHYVTHADGSVNDKRTREASRHFGRATLNPGLHQPFWEMALLNSTVPTVMASVMRRSSLDLEHIPAEVGPIYDRWLTYLLCRDGHAAYFHPEPLTYYRVHEAQESDGLSVNKCAAELYCSEQFVADSRLSDIHPQLEKCSTTTTSTWELSSSSKAAGPRHVPSLSKASREPPDEHFRSWPCLSFSPRIASVPSFARFGRSKNR